MAGERPNFVYCHDCRKRFTMKPLKHKAYSSQVITSAISSYNLGCTLEDATKAVNQRFKVNVSKSSVHSWVTEFADICTYQELRSQVAKRYDRNMLMEYSFYRSGLTYKFMVHVPKLEMLCHRHPSLIRYLKDMHTRCPNDVFEKGERCSQVRLDVRMKKQGFYNQACRLAGLALTACKRKTQRHNVVYASCSSMIRALLRVRYRYGSGRKTATLEYAVILISCRYGMVVSMCLTISRQQQKRTK